MSDEHKAHQSTPATTLEAYIMGTGPKNEQEHWACGEITRLRAALTARDELLGTLLRCVTNECDDCKNSIRHALLKEEV